MQIPRGVVCEEYVPAATQLNQAVETLRFEYSCGHICNVSAWTDTSRRTAQLAKLAKLPCPSCMELGKRR